ncbi:LOW QUALITY PROTEIN: arylacetamide deacetylase-like 4 [Lepus europaeus]|uniref:LOW QUALITY PROTEIN: arylacetamide deacetylase-like 4 n=1 Tax=Lepus europaeus TaxID=9983 RepID=UPI002B47561A|nr:LOW QUALITY PROTEIN: arylacetamide deacetylase-like 4 [Lepus europaeus]
MLTWLGVLLAAVCVLSLGVNAWVLREHCLTTEIPSTISHPLKLWTLFYGLLLLLTWGDIFEKLGICTMFKFIRFLHDLLPIRMDPQVAVTNLRFGSVPVRLFQPTAPSSGPRRGIIFYHGGGTTFGSLDLFHNLCSFLARETDSVLLSVGYRKLPDHHSPIIMKDCLNASIHFLKALGTYGVDPARVVLCGESVGGGTVAMVTQSLVGRSDLPRIRAQVLIYPIAQAVNLQLPSFQQNQNVPFLTRKFMARLVCNYMTIHHSWHHALVTGSFIPPEAWSKYKKWLSSDNIPKRFKTKSHQPSFPAPFNEAAYLEMKHLLDVENSPILAEDEVIAQLPEAFVVSCGNDILRDDALLYRKRLEDQGVPVTWHHVEDGFHGSVILFDKKHLSFPCSQEIMNAVVCYIKGI